MPPAQVHLDTLVTSRVLLTLLAAACTAAPAPAPASGPTAFYAPVPEIAPSSAPGTTTDANVTGSFGNLCSSSAGLLSALQGAANGIPPAGLNVTVPASLNNAAVLQQTAQVGHARCLVHGAALHMRCLQCRWAGAWRQRSQPGVCPELFLRVGTCMLLQKQSRDLGCPAAASTGCDQA